MPRGNDIARMRQRCATAEQRIMPRCAKAAAEAIAAAVDAEFRKGRDIDGERFLLPKDGHRPPMVRSGALRRSINVSARASLHAWRIRAGSETAYDTFLRDGTSKMDPRKFIPKSGEPMPRAWDVAVSSRIDRIMAQESRP